MECAVVSYPHERVVHLAQGGSALQGLRRLQAGCHQVDLAPLDYGAFRSFLGRLDQALSRKVEAAPPARTAANEAR